MTGETKDLTVKATLDDAISTGLKKIDDSLLSVARTAKASSEQTSGALGDVEKAAKREADVVGKEVVKAHEEAGKAAEGHTSKLKAMKSNVLETLNSFVGFATGGLVIEGASQAFEFLGESINKAMEHGREAEQTQASLNASLAMTGKVTGVTSKMTNELADSLSGITTYSADTILSGESVMAIFQNIGKKVFPDAVKTSLDLAAKLGIDVPTASRLLGRALNDPIKGVTQLTRYGITLTKSQQDSIKHFMKINDVADAQSIILGALHGRLGNVAEAMGSTLTGRMQIFNNKMELMQEKIGEAVIPILTKLLGLFMPLTSWLAEKIPEAIDAAVEIFNNDLAPSVDKVAVYIAKLGSQIENSLVPFFEHLVQTGRDVVQFFRDASPAAQAVESVLGVLAGAFTALAIKTAIFATISKIQMIPTLIVQAQAWWGVAAGVIAATWPILAIGAAVTGIVLLFKHWYDTNETFRNAVNRLVSTALNDLQAIMVAMQPLVDQVKQAWSQFTDTLGRKVQPIIASLVSFVQASLPKIEAAFKAVLNWLQPVWQFLWPWIQATVAVTINNIIGVLSVAFNVILGIIKVATDLLQGNWKGAWNDIQATVHAVWQTIQSTIGADIQIVVFTIQQTFGGVPGFFQGIWNNVTSTVGGAFSRLGTDVHNGLQGIWNNITGTLSNIQRTMSDAWNNVKRFTVQLWNDIVNGIVNAFMMAYNHSYLFQHIVDAIVADWNYVRNLTLTIWGAITVFLSNLWNGIKNTAQSVWNTITTLIGNFLATEERGYQIIWNRISGFLSAIWNGIKNTAMIVWGAISAVLGSILQAIWSRISSIWNQISSYLSGIWNNIKGTASSIWNGISSAIASTVQGLFNRIGSIMNGLHSAAVNWATGMRDGLVSGITGAWGAVQNALHGIVNNIVSFVKNALGIHSPSRVFMDIGMNMMLGMIHGFRGGDLAGNISGFINHSLGGLGGVISSVVHKGLVSLNGIGSMGSALLNKLGLGNLLPSLVSAASGLVGHFAGSGNVYSWLQQALGLTGEPLSWLGPLSLIAQHESAGNPNAINLWDINAKRGTPSKGLMQVIDPTFLANMLPGHGNIWNPVDNAIAAIRYIARRYGGVYNVPGVASMMRGGPYVGYAEGGVIHEPIAGIGLRTGTQYAFGERGAEAIVPLNGRASGSGSASGTQVIVQIYLDSRQVSNVVGAGMVERIRTVTQRKV